MNNRIFKLVRCCLNSCYLGFVVLVVFMLITKTNCSDFLLGFRNSGVRKNAPQTLDLETEEVDLDQKSGFTVNSVNTVSVEDEGSDEIEESDEKLAPDLFSIRVRVLEIPGESFIRITGKKVNTTDVFGNASPRIEFRGLPFAHPPVNSLRFQRPTMKILTRDFKALEEPPECPQLSTNGRQIGKEDCLYLSIYVPQQDQETLARASKSKMPVLLWFHGENQDRSADGKYGVLSSGSAKELAPDIFMQNKIVVVTPQYRLGSLGFMSTVNEDLNGNMGLFDQLLALEWIQRFIQYFGGDPKQVTIMGHGSSAISLGLLATSDLARGLYHRMILMGGSPLSPISIDPTPKQTFAEIALQNACPSFPTLRFVRCMQKRRLETIVEADDRLTKGKHLGNAKMPLPILQRSADGRFLPPFISTSPTASFSRGNFDPVPIVIGVSSSEMSGFLPSIAGKLRHEIPTAIFTSNTVLKHFIRAVMSRGPHDPELIADLAAFEYFGGLNVSQRQDQAKDLVEELLSDFLYHIPALKLAKMWSRYAPVYFYVFDYVTTNSERLRHGESLERDSDSDLPSFPEVFQAYHGSDVRFLMNGHKGSAEDRTVATAMIDFWANFIHKGSPLHSGIDWPQFRENTKEYLYIGSEIGAATDFRKRQDLFWSGLVEEVNGRVCKSSSMGAGRGNRNKQPSIFKESQDTQDNPSKGYFYLGNLSNDNIEEIFNF